MNYVANPHLVDAFLEYCKVTAGPDVYDVRVVFTGGMFYLYCERECLNTDEVSVQKTFGLSLETAYQELVPNAAYVPKFVYAAEVTLRALYSQSRTASAIGRCLDDPEWHAYRDGADDYSWESQWVVGESIHELSMRSLERY